MPRAAPSRSPRRSPQAAGSPQGADRSTHPQSSAASRPSPKPPLPTATESLFTVIRYRPFAEVSSGRGVRAGLRRATSPEWERSSRAERDRVRDRPSRVIDKADTRTLDSFVRQMVSDRVSLLATDEHSGYRHLGEAYPHHVIRKSRQTTWSGAVHTNTIEAFWSIFK